MLAAVAQRLDGDRLVVALGRDHEPRGEVEQDAGPADERERGERDPVDERVDVEVAAEAGRDAAEPAAFVAADEPPDRRLVGGVVGSIVSDMRPPVMIPHQRAWGGARRHPARP